MLWHAITVLREQRGDGHIAALQVAGLDPCEALVSFSAIGAAPEDVFASRGWSAAEWSAARDRLTARMDHLPVNTRSQPASLRAAMSLNPQIASVRSNSARKDFR